MVADETGEVVSEVRYSAFGEIRYDSGTMTTDYLYTGQRQEAEIGLHYYVARWYDPAIGRFIQADSVVPYPGSALGYDRYGFAFNNPILYADPSGHCPACIIPPLLLLLLLSSCSNDSTESPVSSEVHTNLTTQMDNASTPEQRQAVIDSVIDEYQINTSNVVGNVQYNSAIEAQARASVDGIVQIGFSAFESGENGSHSVGWLALAIEHEVEIHINTQLYGGRRYNYDVPNDTLSRTLDGLMEHEAYSYMRDKAESYGLYDWEINNLDKSIKTIEDYDIFNPYLMKYIKRNGYVLPQNENGQTYIPMSRKWNPVVDIIQPPQ